MLRHEVAWEPQDLPRLLRTKDVHVIHGRRQSGKTTELLTLARQRHQDEFAFISMNQNMAECARHLYWVKFTPIQHIDSISANPRMPRLWPMFLGAHSLVKLEGQVTARKERVPVFVDEWNSLHPTQQRQILDHNFIIAVTS